MKDVVEATNSELHFKCCAVARNEAAIKIAYSADHITRCRVNNATMQIFSLSTSLNWVSLKLATEDVHFRALKEII